MATAAVCLPAVTPSTVITDEQRRWVVIGICLNKLLTPVLRTVLANEISLWYNNLCLPPNQIDKQIYGTHYAKKLPPSKIILHTKVTTFLKYGNINKNYDNYKSTYSAYDYKVKDPESLAKLFVQPFMAKFSGFDQTMDLSAALTLICEANPFHTSGAAAQANTVRSVVRNEWAHCDFSHWNDVNYLACIQHIESLVKKLNLSSADENDFVNELDNWKDKGVQLCCGQAVDPDLLGTMKTEVAKLYDSVAKWREENQVAQSQIMETVHSVHQFFNKEIQNLQEIQYAIRKDIEDLKVEQESLSVNYKTTSQQVEALENQVAKLAIENQEVPYLFMLPDRTEWFSGRESELENLHSLLQDVNEPKVKVASVCGLGGSGKTSLVAEYAHRWKDAYDGGVFWFSGEDESKFANSVDDHAVYFGTLLEASPGRILVKTLEVISKIRKPWLLVLDDMDEFKLCSNIGMLLSGPWKRTVKGSGHILITTRRKPKVMSETIRAFKESQCLQLECFSLEDGKRFVFKRTGISSDDETSAEAANLVETLGGLPLALEQACAYITHLSCTLSMYLKQYEKYSLELLDEQDAISASLYESPQRLAVRTTWLLNFDFIKQSKNGNFAVRFLHACAFFNPNEIQQELVNPGKPPIEDEGYRDYVNTPLGPSHILKLLTDFSLFRKNKGSSLTVHRLVQEVIQGKLRSDDEGVLSLVDAIRMLSFAFSTCPSPDDLLSLSDVNSRQERASNLATNPSLFYSWRKLCLHAQEVLEIINSFQVLDKRILMPETARIAYECALDFNISSKTSEARKSVDFAHKIIHLGSTHLTKDDLAAMFPHDVPLPERVRRYILYSSTSPRDTADTSTSDKSSRIGSKSNMEQMHAEGNSYFNSGNFHKAVETYSSAMAEISSFDPKLLCDRALAYINLQQYKNALDDSGNYILQRPKCWLGFALKALALHGLNEIWEASRFAALAFYHNRNIFCDYEPFKSTFPALKGRIHICDRSSLLTDILLKPVSKSPADVEWPSKIMMIEPGDYVVNSTLPLFIEDCVLLGLENSKSSAVVRFNELRIGAGRHIMAANLSFLFTTGNWISFPDSITTWLNCCFSSSLEESEHTFLCYGTDTFRDCSFENSKSPGLTVKGKTDVQKCVFSGGEYSGVHVSTGGNLEIKESKLHGNETGIYIANAPAVCNITNCEIFDNKLHGVNVERCTCNVRVENCRIYQNDRNGIHVQESSSAFVSNSEIFENGWTGIATVLNSCCTISHNRIHGNKSGGVQVVPVDPTEGLSPSIVEFNEIFHNRGHGIYCEMMLEDTPSDTSVCWSENAIKQYMRYSQKKKMFIKAKCNGNKCYKNEDGVFSVASTDLKSDKNEVYANFCSYCHQKCSSNCAKCFVTTYCNKKCQSNDWKKHKKECHSILEKSTVCLSIPPKEHWINLEHARFVPSSSSQHPGLALKGPQYNLPPNSKDRFLVKILAADEKWHSNSVGPLFTICDRSLTINGILDRKCYPKLHNIVRECGVSSTVVEGWNKKFFWAKFHNEDRQKLIVFMVKFPRNEDW